MSNRKPAYVIGVVVLALVLSVPQILVGLAFGLGIFSRAAKSPLSGIPGYGTFEGATVLTIAPFWKNKFIYGRNSRNRQTGQIENQFYGIDVESGEITKIISASSRGWFFNQESSAIGCGSLGKDA